MAVTEVASLPNPFAPKPDGRNLLLQIPIGNSQSQRHLSALFLGQTLIAASDVADWSWDSCKRNGGTLTVASLQEDSADGQGRFLVLQRYATARGQLHHQLIVATAEGRTTVKAHGVRTLFDYLHCATALLEALEDGMLRLKVAPIQHTVDATRTETREVRRFKLSRGIAELEVSEFRNRPPRAVARFIYRNGESEAVGLELQSRRLEPLMEKVLYERERLPG